MADLPEFVPSRLNSSHPAGQSSRSILSSSQPNRNTKDVTAPHVGELDSEPRSQFSGRAFWGLIVLAVVIIAAAVGGGVGGALATQHAKSNSKPHTDSDSSQNNSTQVTVTVTMNAASTSPPTSSSTTSLPSATSTTIPALDPASIERVNISCPDSTIVSWKGETYSCLETTQVAPSVKSDLTGITAYTLRTCIDACSTWNQLHGGGCYAVSMEWDLSYAYRTFMGANCFLRGTDSPRSSNLNVTSLILS